MRTLLLINQYFWPDMAATAQLLGDLAAAAANAGFEVTVLAGKGGYALPDATRLPSRAGRDGVTIHRVRTSHFGRRTTLGRLTDYVTYLVSAAFRLLTRPAPDLVVCLSTPPLVAVLGLLAKARGARFIYKVEDLYPDVAIALGALPERSLAAAFPRRLSRLLLRRADICVALDSSMAAGLKTRGAARVEVIPNWADGEAIYPDPDAGRRFREAEGLDDRMLVLYSGNMGMAHRFDAIEEAILRLSEDEAPLQFLFVGGGVRRPELQRVLGHLGSVHFLPYQPRERLHELYNAADLHLVSLRSEVAGLLVPSKYPAALAPGKSVLLVGGDGTEMGEEIRSRGLGFVVPHDSREVTRALGTAANSGTVGCPAARVLFEEKYSKEVLLPEWLDLLEGLSPGASGSP